MSAREEYYQRIQPVVGESFFRRSLAVWDLGFGHLPAEALARTGLRRQIWFDAGSAGASFCDAWGAAHAGSPRAAALGEHCRRHNGFEQDWALHSRPPTLAELKRLLAGASPPDALLARADAHAEGVARAAIAAGVPLILIHLPQAAQASCLALIWTPASRAAIDDLLALARALARSPQLALDPPQHRLELLEAQSLALGLTKWLLVGDHAARPDLNGPLVEQGRALLVRGHPGWPWAVSFLPPELARLQKALTPAHTYRPPRALYHQQRLLVIGLGTASLFCAAAPLIARQLVFLDAKEVSVFNPVRQIYGTDRIGQAKPRALQEILMQRLAPADAWDTLQQGPLRLQRSGPWTLGEARLQLRSGDPGSVRRLEAVLDAFQPTLAIIGMGRTKNDNFLAAEVLRRRGIRHLTPSAFPGVSHFKHILTDGDRGPCYDCLQGHLGIDGGAGPELSAAERQLYYGGTQPATLAETYPSAHSLLRLAAGLALPPAARPGFLLQELAAERCCFVAANRAQPQNGGWLYGVDRPFAMVTYGARDILPSSVRRRCSCGRAL